MKKMKQKIVTSTLLVVLLISTVVVVAVPQKRCSKGQIPVDYVVNDKQDSLNKNIMIFKNCIDYFSDLSKAITQ